MMKLKSSAFAQPQRAPKKSGTIEGHLNLLVRQRKAIFRDLSSIELADFWRRPAPGKWSAGEHLDHTCVLNIFCYRLLKTLWWGLSPVGRMRRSRDFPGDIENIYQQSNKFKKVGFLWPPRYDARRPLPIKAMHKRLARPHRLMENFYRSQPEDVLGNTYVWDPMIGVINYVQVLRIACHHDLHHYNAARRILGLPMLAAL